ncbi:hypothetical protein Mic7113_0466 [Allocoleopsis franciscana PCC 7113]|uniref:Uncharacterized protein n=1 Tax=Allocoleopsis franciscana PCC 7113 TaxID=1173027 RepID=K9W7L8_9CYAN|nr:hypothetical protein Mic7113_0466 [Allocoleopsis franciscana PCC 7113]
MPIQSYEDELIYETVALITGGLLPLVQDLSSVIF